MKKFCFLAFLSFFALSNLFSENAQFLITQPEESLNLDNGTKILIRTEKSGKIVLINNNIQGKTPLTVKNLLPGFYNIQIKNYKEEKVFWIEVKNQRFDKYFF